MEMVNCFLIFMIPCMFVNQIYIFLNQVRSAHSNGICIHILDILCPLQRIHDHHQQEVAILSCWKSSSRSIHCELEQNAFFYIFVAHPIPMAFQFLVPRENSAATTATRLWTWFLSPESPFTNCITFQFQVLVRNVPPDSDESVSEHVEHFFCVNHPDHYLSHQVCICFLLQHWFTVYWTVKINILPPMLCKLGLTKCQKWAYGAV